MINSKPLPRQTKKTCYNNKCRLLQQLKWSSTKDLGEKNNNEKSLRSTFEETLNKSYFNKRIIEFNNFNRF